MKKKPARLKLKKTEWATELIQHVWPEERDFFERPERYKYVRKLLPKTDECVFCTAAKAKLSAKSLVLHRDKRCMVVMNKYPYNPGHLLVIPRAHQGQLTDLDDKTNAALALWMKRSVQILKKEFQCQGFNLGLNQGAAAGAGIPDHMHWHIVPRWGGDTNFFPLIGKTKVLSQTLEQTYSRLEKYFKSEDWE